jgi:hypothetical protein
MEDVSGSMSYMVNAQEVPKHPMFDGTAREEKRAFMIEYEEYFDSLKPFLTSISAPQLVPVSQCIKINRFRLIAEYEICKPMDEITEDGWILHFRACKEAERKDLTALDAKMTKLKLDLSLGDATPMMSTLTMKIHHTCEELGLRQIFEGQRCQAYREVHGSSLRTSAVQAAYRALFDNGLIQALQEGLREDAWLDPRQTEEFLGI